MTSPVAILCCPFCEDQQLSFYDEGPRWYSNCEVCQEADGAGIRGLYCNECQYNWDPEEDDQEIDQSKTASIKKAAECDHQWETEWDFPRSSSTCKKCGANEGANTETWEILKEAHKSEKHVQQNRKRKMQKLQARVCEQEGKLQESQRETAHWKQRALQLEACFEQERNKKEEVAAKKRKLDKR